MVFVKLIVQQTDWWDVIILGGPSIPMRRRAEALGWHASPRGALRLAPDGVGVSDLGASRGLEPAGGCGAIALCRVVTRIIYQKPSIALADRCGP